MKTNMQIIYAVLAVMLILSVGFYLRDYLKVIRTPESQKGHELRKLTIIGKGEFEIELADNQYKRQLGLMNRTQLDINNGMLFVFDSTGIYPFWMKNTLIPLDMLWIDSDFNIVYIYEDAKPCSNTLGAICNSIIPPKPAKYVLELNSGVVKSKQIQVGDKMSY